MVFEEKLKQNFGMKSHFLKSFYVKVLLNLTMTEIPQKRFFNASITRCQNMCWAVRDCFEAWVYWYDPESKESSTEEGKT